MQHYMAVFKQNAGCGYLPRPCVSTVYGTSPSLANTAKDDFDLYALNITVITFTCNVDVDNG